MALFKLIGGLIAVFILFSAIGEACRGDPTAICWDGTKSYSQNASGTCSWHGGVKEWR